MTQNKKKGIAKKALSISLVAAMLATSNVPAWASGFEAVDAEGFAVEEAVAEEAELLTDNAEAANWDTTTYVATYLADNVEWDNLTVLNKMKADASAIKTINGAAAKSVDFGFITKGAVVDGVLPEDSVFTSWNGTIADAKANIDKKFAVKLTRNDGTKDVEYYLVGNAASVAINPETVEAKNIELTVNGTKVTETSRVVAFADNYTVENVTVTLKDGTTKVTFDALTTMGVTAANKLVPGTNSKGNTFLPSVVFTADNALGFAAGTLAGADITIGAHTFGSKVTFKSGTVSYHPNLDTSKTAIKEAGITTELKDTDYTVEYYSDAQGTQLVTTTAPVAGQNVYMKVVGTGEYANYESVISTTPVTVAKKNLSELTEDAAVIAGIKWDKTNDRLPADAVQKVLQSIKYNSTDENVFDLSGLETNSVYDLKATVVGGTKAGEAVTITIEGVDPVKNYAGSKTITFTPVIDELPVAITNDLEAQLGNIDMTYDAKSHPVQNLLTGEVGTLLKSQYTLSCVEAPSGYIKDAGDYTIVLTVNSGAYAGKSYTATRKVTINKKDLAVFANNKGVTFDKVVYDPSKATKNDWKVSDLNLVLNYNGETLREGVDFELKAENKIIAASGAAGTEFNAALSAVSANAKANYEGEVNLNLGKIQPKELKDVAIPEIPTQIYDASALINSGNSLDNIKAKDENGKTVAYSTLVKDGKFDITSYTVDVTVPKGNIGTVKVIFKGNTNYTGSVTKTFEITNKAVNAEFRYYGDTHNVLGGLPSLPYSYNDATDTKGKGIVFANENFSDNVSTAKNQIVVVDEQGKAVDPAKYDLTYTNNRAVGTATIEATGKDGYELSAIATFQITPKQYLGSDVTVTVKDGPYYYTGEEIKPELNNFNVVDGKYTLKEGVDYQLSYKNNITVATDNKMPTVVVTGMGNYTFVTKEPENKDATVNTGVSGTFTITPTNITKENVTISDVDYAGGLEVTPDVKVVNVNSGKELVKDTDYTVTITNGVNAGAATATIKLTDEGQKNYTINSDATNELKINFKINKKNLADCKASIVDGKVVIKNGEITVPATEYTVTDNEDGTFTVKAAEKNYTGTITVSAETAPEATTLRVTDRTTSTVSLAWDEVEGAEGYTIWFRSEYETSVSRKIITGGDVTTWTQKGLQPGTKYFYTVKAWVKDAEGNYVFSEQSPVQRGTTKPLAAKITAVSAANGKVKVTLAGKAAGAEMYSMCYSKSANFDDFKVGIRTSYTTRTFKNALTAGTYYVRVKSYRDLGNNKRVYGAWSNTMKVVVK